MSLEKELELYKKEIEILNSEIDTLAYIISHDLQAPIRGIKGFSDILRRKLNGKIEEKDQKLFENIEESAEQLRSMVAGVLRFSRATRAKGDISNSDANKALQDALNELKIPPNFTINFDHHLPKTVNIPENYLKQVFQAILENSVQFSDRKDAVIEISYENLSDEYRFTIKDNGPGIDPKYHKKVFKLFRTAGQATTNESPGVGLTIAHKIITKYGGDIWIESEGLRDTSVIFTIKKNHV